MTSRFCVWVGVLGLGVFIFGPAAPARADSSPGDGRYRLVDVGLRPLFSFPDALGLSVAVHPLGGRLTVEGAVGMQPFESVGPSVALEYRLPVITGDSLHLSVGPGVGWLWICDGPSGPVTGQLVSGFAATEAVFWHDQVGFRLGLDLGVAYTARDEPGYGHFDRFYPVFNGTIGVAFRTSRAR
jgi:hypothetical protein